VSHTLRTLAGCTMLAAGLWAVTTGVRAETPKLPTDSYKKAAEADLKFLQTRLDELAGTPDPRDGKVKPAIGAALSLAVYADALGDATLRDEAMKVAEALNKKDRDIKGAAGIAKKMAIKPGATKGKGGLPKLSKDDKMLEYAMQAFRPKAGGGMGLERDLDEYTSRKNPRPIDAADIELLAVRTGVALEFAKHYPNEIARKSPADMKKWEKLSADSVDAVQKILAETAKKKPDEKALRTLLNNLSAKCTDCHGMYRDI
jgi:hypothetical protein